MQNDKYIFCSVLCFKLNLSELLYPVFFFFLFNSLFFCKRKTKETLSKQYIFECIYTHIYTYKYILCIYTYKQMENFLISCWRSIIENLPSIAIIIILIMLHQHNIQTHIFFLFYLNVLRKYNQSKTKCKKKKQNKTKIILMHTIFFFFLS